MRNLGYVEGQNLLIEYRYAEGKPARLSELAAELVRLRVDVIVTAGGARVAQTAKESTSTIPIVMTGSTDPVAIGLTASLARPGGNITGLSLGGPELYGKRFELIKEAIPKLSRLSVFYVATAGTPFYLKEMHASARALSLQIELFEVRTPGDFQDAFLSAAKGGAGAFTVTVDPEFTGNRKQILDYAQRNRLPAIYPWREYVQDGGLMSYAPNLADLYRRAANYVDKILKGSKPADLPVEQPTKFDFVINLKTAKQIGLTIPPTVLARADKLIK